MKKTFVDDGDIQLVTDLMGILIVQFLEAILCIVLVFLKIEAFNIIQPLMIVPR